MIPLEIILAAGLFLISAGLIGCVFSRDRDGYPVSLYHCTLGICLVLSSDTMISSHPNSQVFACIITGLLAIMLLAMKKLDHE